MKMGWSEGPEGKLVPQVTVCDRPSQTAYPHPRRDSVSALIIQLCASVITVIHGVGLRCLLKKVSGIPGQVA